MYWGLAAAPNIVAIFLPWSVPALFVTGLIVYAASVAWLSHGRNRSEATNAGAVAAPPTAAEAEASDRLEHRHLRPVLTADGQGG